MKGNDWSRRALTLLMAIVIGMTGLAVSPAYAGPGPSLDSFPAGRRDAVPAFNSSTCTQDTALTFGWVGNVTDPDGASWTGVSRSQSFEMLPFTLGCDAPYEGHNSTCMTVRLVVLYSPSTGRTHLTGAWTRSCWSWIPTASGFGGWVHHDDYVFVEARAEADGDTTPAGHLLY